MSSNSAALTIAAENLGSFTRATASSARARVRSAITIDSINERRDAIFAIALPTPPAPITRAFMIFNSKRIELSLSERGFKDKFTHSY